ncbi:hypothetical protein PLESTF_001018100 [Pleodorina starrii]|nr:hypothetical protein PLESTF_001018100 [Pleodorina starrii]
MSDAGDGLLTPEGRRVLGALSFLVFNPALIFVKLASTLTPARLLHWWPLVLNTGISTLVGLGLGYLGVRLVRPPHSLRPHTVVAIALGNLGNLPLVIVSSLATSSAEVLHGIPPDRAEDLAVSYVVVGLLVPVIAHATIGFSMLRKPNSATAVELPEAAAAEAGTGADGAEEAQVPPQVAALTAAARADGGGTAAARRWPVKDEGGGEEDGHSADYGVAVVVDAAGEKELQKRPLLAEHRAAAAAAAAAGVGVGVGVGMAGSSSSSCGAERTSWSGGDGGGGRLVSASSGGGGGGAAPRRSSPGVASERDVAADHKQQQQQLHPGESSSSGVPTGASPGEPVRLYGGAVGCLGPTADGDHHPLLEPPPPPPPSLLHHRHHHQHQYWQQQQHQQHQQHHQQQHQQHHQQQHQQHIVEGPGPVVREMELGRIERTQGQQAAGPGPGSAAAAAAAAAAVDLPPQAGVRSALPGCPSPSLGSDRRRRRPLPLPRLQGWHPRIDWRALGTQVLREAVSPPLLAILLSVPVGCVPPLQQAFFGGGAAGSASGGGGGGGGGAPLGLLTDCLSMLGECTIPSILLLLGATLAHGPGAARVPLRVIGLVNATRLALLPLLGLGLVMGAYAARIFEAPDPIYLLVLLIQNTAPTAIMVHTMASVHGNKSEEVSSILFWGYIAGIALVPLWLTLFLFVVKQQFRYTEGGAGGDAAAAGSSG